MNPVMMEAEARGIEEVEVSFIEEDMEAVAEEEAGAEVDAVAAMVAVRLQRTYKSNSSAIILSDAFFSFFFSVPVLHGCV